MNGREIDFILYDDGYDPAPIVEQTRKLAEEDKLFSWSSSQGRTAPKLPIMHRGSAGEGPGRLEMAGAFNVGTVARRNIHATSRPDKSMLVRPRSGRSVSL